MVIDKRALIWFLMFTFLFTYLSWGVIIAANRFGLLGFDTPFGTILYICGTWAPTIFSYVCLKKKGIIRTIKDFAKIAFSFKVKSVHYLLVFIFLAVLYIPSIIFCGSNTDTAWYLWLPIFPLMMMDGGMEELGWRYLLQPTLEKRFPFLIATMITAIIWWAWHLPMFFIAGSGQSEMSFMLFALFIFGQSFSLAVIFQTGKSIWLCIMYHALLNTLVIYWPVAENLAATLISLVCTIALSVAIVSVKKRNKVSSL